METIEILSVGTWFTENLLPIILSAIGVVLTGLASWVVTKITKWLNEKIGDEKAAKYLSTITELVMNSVKEVYQTYVEALKEKGEFNEEAQKEALERCLARIKNELAPEITEYITENFGDLTEYLKGLIESTIYNLKQ